MNSKIVPIGTSKGIRIPKYLIDKYHFSGEVSIEETEKGILIKPLKKTRDGWKKAFLKIVNSKHDVNIDIPPSDWDENEWEW